MKADMAQRQARTKRFMDELDPELRVSMEGFRPGSYLRLRFKGTRPDPCSVRARVSFHPVPFKQCDLF